MKTLVIGLVVLSLAGCASSSVSVSPKTSYVAVNSFNIAEATATNYLRLKKCTGDPMPLCRDPGATARIIPAVRTGQTARNEVRKGQSGSLNTLSAATATLNSIFQQYSIRSGQ